MYLPVDWPVPDLVARQAGDTPNRTALVSATDGRAWTYGELSTGPIDALAAGIRSAGLTPGSHLGALVPPGPRMAQLVFAVGRSGVILVPLAPDAPVEILEERCDVADVDTVVCSARTERTALRAFDGPVVSVARSGSSVAPSLWNRPVDSPPIYLWNRSELRWLVFTSGTLGEPKAVQLTTRNLLASATASAFRLGVSPDDRWLACLPMHHVSGLAPLVRSALYGTAVVVQSDFDVGESSAAMADFDVTGVSLVPTMLGRLLDAGWTPPDSLRFVLLGGAPASRGLIERCEAARVPVHATYGATETATQVATTAAGEAFDHPGTVGRPLTGLKVTVLDEDYKPLPQGETGELVVDGPTVSPGYYGDEGETAWRFDERGFHTRDRGYCDDAGRLWVKGRTDDAVITGGVTVQPGEVESALRSHPAVDGVAVVGLDDDEWGQIVAVLVSVADTATLDASTLREYCRGRLEPHAVPKVVRLVETLPRTASGTIDRSAVRDRLTGPS